MFEPCVIVFCDTFIPLRHIILLTNNSGKDGYDEEEFKAWYYSQFSRLDNDQFVYCESRSERDTLCEKLKKSQVYHVTAPLWAEVENSSGDIEDMYPTQLRKFTAAIKSDFQKFLKGNPIPVKEMDESSIFHASVSVGVDKEECPVLDIVLWLDREDIPEKAWNRLYSNLDSMLFSGWGKNFSDIPIKVNDTENLWVHFGKPNAESIDYSVYAAE